MKQNLTEQLSHIKKMMGLLNEQQEGPGDPQFKEGPGEPQINEYDHYNNIVKPQLLKSGFKDDYDKNMEEYGTENLLTYGGHNHGVNVLWHKPRNGKEWSYIVWKGNNVGSKSFPIGGTNDSKMVANNVVKYALSLKNMSTHP